MGWGAILSSSALRYRRVLVLVWGLGFLASGQTVGGESRFARCEGLLLNHYTRLSIPFARSHSRSAGLGVAKAARIPPSSSSGSGSDSSDEEGEELLARWRSQYAGRNIVVFTDATMQHASGVPVVMKTLKSQIETRTGVKVIYIDPLSIRRKVSLSLGQGQKFYHAFPSDPEIATVLSTFDPIAVHIVTERAIGLAARSYLRRHGIPYTTAYHTDWSHHISARVPGFLKPLTRKMVISYLRRFHAGSEAILIPSQRMLQKLATADFLPSQLRAWSHGVNLEQFHPEPRDPLLLERLAHAQGDRTFGAPHTLMLSRLSSEKNVEDFFRMKIPGTKYFVGPGSERNLARFRKKYPDVVFLGRRDHQTELPDIYRSADVFVFPSYSETYGLVVAEAIASGCPVVGYDVQGICDIITDPRAGTLVKFDPEDPDGNVARLEQAFTQVSALERSQVRAYAEHLDWKKSTVQFLSFLHRLDGDRNR